MNQWEQRFTNLQLWRRKPKTGKYELFCRTETLWDKHRDGETQTKWVTIPPHTTSVSPVEVITITDNNMLPQLNAVLHVCYSYRFFQCHCHFAVSLVCLQLWHHCHYLLYIFRFTESLSESQRISSSSLQSHNIHLQVSSINSHRLHVCFQPRSLINKAVILNFNKPRKPSANQIWMIHSGSLCPSLQ